MPTLLTLPLWAQCCREADALPSPPGSSYWLFRDTIMEEGFPRPISDLGLPLEGVDAAFVWLHNHKTYFFKERRYWRYDEQLRQMDPGYPKDSALWKGLPPHLDGAMSWSDGEATFDLSSQPDFPSGRRELVFTSCSCLALPSSRRCVLLLQGEGLLACSWRPRGGGAWISPPHLQRLAALLSDAV